MRVQVYLERRRWYEVAITVGLIAVSFVANSLVAWFDLSRSGQPFRPALPWVLEGTSHVSFLLLVPFVLAFDRRFPLGLATWRRSLPAHALFSVVFALAHVGLFYVLRQLAFGPDRYHWDRWWTEFGYEYLKDFRSYMLLLTAIYLYRFVLIRLQGEAGFVAEADAGHADTEAAPERLLVKKLGREFLVRVDDIDWIESSGNYVNLHVGGKVYPLRATMTSICDRFETRGFVRVHRRAIVNLDRVVEIEVFDTGDGEIRLSTDSTVPVSRRFRKALAPHVGH